MLEPRFREDFPACATSTYVNVAARSPLSDTVSDKLEAFMASARADGGDKPGWLAEIAELRGRVANLIGSQANEIAFVKSTSDGLGAVAAAFPFEPGDNVVVCPDLEHANNVYLWLNLQSRGVEVRTVPTENNNVSIDTVRDAIDERTRILSIAAVSFVTGTRPDLAALSALCDEVGAMFVVDAVQCVGAVQMDVEALGIDAMAAATQKMLLALYGAGFLYVREKWLDRLQPPILSVQGVQLDGRIESDPAMLDYKLHDSARQFEVGNPNFAGLLAFSGSLSIIEAAGPANVDRHVTDLAAQLMEELEGAGVDVITPQGSGAHGGIVSFRLPDPEAAAALFAAEGIVVSMRRGLVRTSFHLFSNEDDVTRVVDTVRKLQTA